jgi:cysteine desulfurase/selenocysteine lyase
MSDVREVVDIGPGDAPATDFDVERVRADFPILRREVYGRPLVYLDNAASAQKPRQVIDAMDEVYEQGYANVHRGAHYLSQTLTERYEGVRETVPASSTPARTRRSCSPATPPRRSTWSRTATAAGSRRATR